MCKLCKQAFRLTPFHHLVLNLSSLADIEDMPTSQLKVSFTLDLDKLNYARELRGVPVLTMFQLQDLLAQEGVLRLHGPERELEWYNDAGEIRWNVV